MLKHLYSTKYYLFSSSQTNNVTFKKSLFTPFILRPTAFSSGIEKFRVKIQLLSHDDDCRLHFLSNETSKLLKDRIEQTFQESPSKQFPNTTRQRWDPFQQLYSSILQPRP